jgi:DNA-binding NarL/FixJ family response regulator
MAIEVTDRRRHAQSPRDVLTTREREVALVCIEAGSAKATAHELGIAEQTVKNHLANVRSKLGATNMAQVAWILARARLSTKP